MTPMRRWIGGAVAGALVVAGAGAWLAREPGGAPPAGATPPMSVATTAPPVATPPPAPPLHQAAHAVVPNVAVYDRPGGTVVRTLPHPTVERVPLAFLTLARQDDWLQVRLAVRPNGSTGWIRAADVMVEDLAHRVVIERGTKRLRVLRGDTVVLEEQVAVGTPRTPTPLGDFFIDAIVVNPGGVYGAYQLSVAGFSDVLMRFGGGIGQIAIHGTNAPQLIGGEVSNGCIRMRNDAIKRVAALTPLGTPVTIVA